MDLDEVQDHYGCCINSFMRGNPELSAGQYLSSRTNQLKHTTYLTNSQLPNRLHKRLKTTATTSKFFQFLKN